MKKNLLFLLAVLLTLSVNAEARKSVLRQMPYAIISDVYSKDVPAGKCVVMGVVTSSYEVDGKGNPLLIQGGEISTLDRKKTSFTNEKGEYKLLLDSKDTSLFFFNQLMEEIVIWNYTFQSQHIVTINFYPGINSNMLEVDKPVIYLYSENKINAEIKFTCKGDLTFTYPAYNDAWNVVVDGNQITESGKKYPYLFWEAETNELNYEIENQTMNGFLIKTDSVVDFLESSLTTLGLNSIEQTDFITFWAPKMIAKPYALVQFFIDDMYTEKISELTITPTPDAIRRVFMMFTPLDNDEINLSVLPQELNSFQRKACLSDGQVRLGFTVLEWGGSEMRMSNLIP